MRLDPSFAAAVAEVQTVLAAWRRQRKRQDPIPEILWHDIVRLAQAYQPSRVAQALRLNYTSLKRRTLASQSATTARTGGSARLHY